MSFIASSLYGLGRPLALGLLLILGLSLLSSDPASGSGDTFGCYTLTDRPEINRALCKLNPARIWNMPVSDLLPDIL